jgi:hypothetical protein
MHRRLVGRVERLTIKREAGEWYAIFIAELETPAKAPINTLLEQRIKGVDLGLEKFAVFDNANDAEYPELFLLRQSENKIKALQRRLAPKKRRRATSTASTILEMARPLQYHFLIARGEMHNDRRNIAHHWLLPHEYAVG